MKRIQALFTCLLALAMLAGLAQPVLAEAPPPPDDGGSPEIIASSPGSAEAEEEVSAEGGDAADLVRPPESAPSAVAGPTQAFYQADGALVDLSGNPVVQASELAEALMAAKEVRGCPPGVMPVIMGGTGAGCTAAYTVINDAIANPSVVGGWTVWVSATFTYPEAVTISKAIAVAGEYTKTDHQIPTIDEDVTFTSGNASLRDFVIFGQVAANGTAGKLTLANLKIYAPGTYAVDIENHNGAVTLMNVLSHNNVRGAVIQTVSTLPVNIINSVFDNSSGFYGVYIDTKGPVKIENVSINNTTGGDGLYLAKFGSQLTIKNSTFLTNHDAANDDGDGYGIKMPTTGSGGKVLIDNTYVGGNQEGGALFNNIGDLVISAGNFSANNTAGGDGGLVVTNGKGAATISNSYFLGNVGVGFGMVSTGQGSSNITNTRFADNTTLGLLMQVGGNVSLKGVRSMPSGLPVTVIGAFIDNVTKALAARSVIVQESIFSSNTVHGLAVFSRGSVSMNHVFANANTSGTGITIDNCWSDGNKCRTASTVTISNTLGHNETMGNGLTGLDITSGGTVSLTDVHSGGNLNGYGLLLRNHLGSGSVYIKQSEFGHNQIDGANILTKGSVTISQTDASFNHMGGSGFVIDNSLGAARPVSISDAEVINSRDYGIRINASGAVTLKNIDLEITSTSHGILLDNTVGSSSVSLSNLTVLGSHFTGLQITTKGTVSANGLDIQNSGNGGLVINNISTTPRSVTLNNVNIDNNSGFGMIVLTRGNITLNHAWVWNSGIGGGNSGFGAVLDNCLDMGTGCTGSGAVAINDSYGDNWFEGNDDFGLRITSKGAVTLNNVLAGWNNVAGYGAKIDNSQGTAPVTINRSRFEANHGYGLEVKSRGTIRLNHVVASENIFEYGALLDNSGAASTPGVYVYNSDFVNNNVYGLQVKSRGTITVNNLTASSNNTQRGVLLDNTFGSASVYVQNTMGNNVFQYNGMQGIEIQSHGSVSVNGVLAEENGTMGGNSGIFIANTNGPGSVTLSNIISNGNEGSGISVVSFGRVTMNKIITAQNKVSGIYVNNADGTTSDHPVTITNAIADGNASFGIYVFARGQITLDHAGASYNLGSGMNLINNGGGGVSLLSTLGPNKAVGNAYYGVIIGTSGNILINNMRVSENGMLNPALEGSPGMKLSTSGASNITISCSVINSNGMYGIEAYLGNGLLKLVGSFAFYNDRKGGVPHADVSIPYAFVPSSCGY